MSGALLFLVPARGGSVRVPGKNLQLVAGIPLVARAIRTARLAAAQLEGGPHRVVCSTDDPAIAAVAAAWHAEVLDRPAVLATAAATSADVALHALDALAGGGGTGPGPGAGANGRPATVFEALVLVQPTSPLTEPTDLVAAVERFRATGRPITSVTASHPAAWHLDLDPDVGGISPVGAAGGADLLSGAIYVTGPDLLRAGGTFAAADRVGIRLPAARSVDVDEPQDLVAADALAGAGPVRVVELGSHRIGDGPVFVIAEGGVNHNGDPALAHRLVDAAADSGADAIKFQTFDPRAIASAAAPTADYQRASTAQADQRTMLEALALPPDAWPALRDHARERGLVFFSSPFDDASADLLEQLGVPAFKVASGELTNLPFLERLARVGRPMLVSTGMADMVEVADAIDAIAAGGDPPVALFHCVSSYPARPEDANLRAIGTLRRAFGVPAGWSDHTPGIELPIAAVAAGASLVEKHLTLDRTMAGPDHAASLEPEAFSAMVAAIRIASAALGNGVKAPTAAELPIARVSRKSLHWRVALSTGAIVAPGDLVAMRPGTGLSPARLGTIAGRRTARAVEAGQAVREDDLAPAAGTGGG